MKGKTKKRKIGKILLLGLSFILTIVVTFSITMAWFFDSDWASKDITMAGKVGIELRDYNQVTTSGQDALNFKISTDKAYPGQSVQVSAEVRNNSADDLTTAGGACYIRARFSVYTDITDSAFDASKLYTYISKLITAQNSTATNYCWNYYQAGATPLSDSGISDQDISYYLNGKNLGDADPGSSVKDDGYYYLCYKANMDLTQKIPTPSTADDATATEDQTIKTTANILKPLSINESNVFLMNSTFIIPWTLTNDFADKTIRLLVTFQAIQTFIPQIGSEGGVSAGFISTAANNQLLPSLCTFNSNSVTTVFNSCSYAPIEFKCHHCGAEASVSKFTENSLATDKCQGCQKEFGLQKQSVNTGSFTNPYTPA